MKELWEDLRGSSLFLGAPLTNADPSDFRDGQEILQSPDRRNTCSQVGRVLSRPATQEETAGPKQKRHMKLGRTAKASPVRPWRALGSVEQWLVLIYQSTFPWAWNSPQNEKGGRLTCFRSANRPRCRHRKTVASSIPARPSEEPGEDGGGLCFQSSKSVADVLRDAVKKDDDGEVNEVSMEPMQSTSACIPKWPDVQARFPLLRPRGLLSTASGVAVTAAVSARHHLGAWPRNRRCPPDGLTHLGDCPPVGGGRRRDSDSTTPTPTDALVRTKT